MPILALNDVSVTYTGRPVLAGVSLQIEPGERLGLLGRNGAGKSTLLRILEGTLAPDDGEVFRGQGTRIAALPQDVPLEVAGNVHDYLLSVSRRFPDDASWEVERRIDQMLFELALDRDADVARLSAGSKRRVLLAAALVAEPDMLLLDEPTNHLDIATILHLESVLLRRRGALVFVTHDRSFLRRLATRILDLDRGSLRSYPGDYEAYLERREAELAVEGEQAALFDRRLAEEEAWLRRGIRARRTRNEGRVRALLAMREERGARREETGRVRARLEEAERSGRIVLRARGLTHAYAADAGGDTAAVAGAAATPVIRDFDLTLQRGDRVGLIGPNGCGKTTLLRLLLGELAPSQGEVVPGVRLEIAHFEQLHDVLDESRSVRENVAEGRDTITVGGGERHVVGYLRDFLFTPEQIQGPVTKLSGGERKRLQLALVLSRPCNLLVLDEPTNDLDLETLELMEELLLEFEGTLLVVSHDREFLDRVVTSTLVWEGEGTWREYAGGYSDWERLREAEARARGGSRPGGLRAGGAGRSAGARRAASGATESPAGASPERPSSAEGAARVGADAVGSGGRARKLTYAETRELEALPACIEALEAERAALVALMATPEFYRSRVEDIAAKSARAGALDAEIETAYGRWEELETLREASGR